jgi:hypothetical protein
LLHDKAVILPEYLKQEKVVEHPHLSCLVTFFYFRGSENTLLEENIKREYLGLVFFPVSEQYTAKRL